MKWSQHEKDLYVPTEQERQVNKWFLEQCKLLGIENTHLRSNKKQSEDEIQAIEYLTSGKAVPEQLKNRLIQKKSEEAKLTDTGESFDIHQFDDELKDYII